MPGLRREEVADRAGLSTDWYTRIEQGRDVNPSAEVLDAIASALSMSAVERGHLHTLACRRAGDDVGPPSDASGLIRLVDALTDAPALVLDSIWNVVGENARARELWGAWSAADFPGNNLLQLFFTDIAFTGWLVDEDRHARLAIRQYRCVFAREAGNARVRTLVSDLADRSERFCRWWSDLSFTHILMAGSLPLS